MARTRSRPSRLPPVTAAVQHVAVVEAPPAARPRTGASATWLGRAFRVCASLQLAIALLSLFTLCLVVATLVESAYSTKIAQDLVYRTWWFSLLLVLLAVNVLCAALKKYPWKKHQTGFLITHGGLLVLVFGGLLTVLGGTDGSMTLTDTQNPGVQTHYGPNASRTVLLPDEHTLEVWQAHRTPGVTLDEDRADVLRQAIGMGRDVKDFVSGPWEVQLRPGPFTWRADEHTRAALPTGLQVLHTLATPFPGLSRSLDGRTVLSVENYYAHTESVPYSPAPPGEDAWPALKIELQSPKVGSLPERWVVARPRGEYRLPSGNALVELLVLPDMALLPEFLDPPPPDKMGKHGLLVVRVGADVVRVPIDRDRLPGPVPVGGRTLTVTQYLDNLDDEPNGSTQYPGVKFAVAGPLGKATYLTCARVPHLLPELLKTEGRPVDLSAWFHHPDHHYGDPNLSGVLQLLQAPDGKVYYRVYGKDGLQEKGQALDPDDRETTYPAWKVMGFRFRVADYLAKAVPERRIVAHDVRPGAERMDLVPAVRGTLVRDGRRVEFWVRLGEITPQKVRVGDEWFFVRYGRAARTMDFQITLRRAERVTDPGTERPASFSSDVMLTYEPRPGQAKAEEHHISMNHPLVYGPYKVYQTDYKFLGFDPNDNPVSVSGLTVAHDPGLWFKYAGSVLVVLGIATMFYMKAYFFRA
jgi:ResB-like family